MGIRVLIIDGHRVFGEGLASLLDAEHGFEVVGVASGAAEAVSLLETTEADVMVLDPNLPDLHGADLARAAVKRHPDIRILALVRAAEAGALAHLARCGVAACLSKASAFAALAQALRDLHAGRGQVPGDLLSRTSRARPSCRPRGRCSDQPALSDRETDVLRLVSEGRSNAEIAELLGISPHTVVRHRQNLMRKLDMHSVAELTRHAIRLGLLAMT